MTVSPRAHPSADAVPSGSGRPVAGRHSDDRSARSAMSSAPGDSVPARSKQTRLQGDACWTQTDLARGDLSPLRRHRHRRARLERARRPAAPTCTRLLDYAQRGRHASGAVQRSGEFHLRTGPHFAYRLGPYPAPDRARSRHGRRRAGQVLESVIAAAQRRRTASRPPTSRAGSRNAASISPSDGTPLSRRCSRSNDPGEKPLAGRTLYTTRYGKGAYVFTALSWFRELPAGVPGAYRIFANLISAGQTLPQ